MHDPYNGTQKKLKSHIFRMFFLLLVIFARWGKAEGLENSEQFVNGSQLYNSTS